MQLASVGVCGGYGGGKQGASRGGGTWVQKSSHLGGGTWGGKGNHGSGQAKVNEG